jgi:hypothetical protein
LNVVGIVLLVIGGFFGVLTLLAPVAAGEHRNAATVVGGLLLSGIFLGLGLLLVLL